MCFTCSLHIKWNFGRQSVGTTGVLPLLSRSEEPHTCDGMQLVLLSQQLSENGICCTMLQCGVPALPPAACSDCTVLYNLI